MSSKTTNAYALITLADVKDFVGIDVKGSANDAVIVDLIDRVTAGFEKYCDRKFESRTYTERYDGDGSDHLYLKNFPITSVSGIFDDSDWAWAASTELTSTTYRIEDEIGIVRKSGYVFTEGTQNLQATYTGGYSEATMPGDLKQACVDEVSRLFTHRRDGDVTVKSTDEESITFAAKNYLPSTLRVLDRYKRIGNIL